MTVYVQALSSSLLSQIPFKTKMWFCHFLPVRCANIVNKLSSPVIFIAIKVHAGKSRKTSVFHSLIVNAKQYRDAHQTHLNIDYCPLVVRALYLENVLRKTLAGFEKKQV